MSKPKLYSYFRSSSAYRVRIALNLKGVEYDYVPVHLVKEGGEQNKDSYFQQVNPMKQVPAFEHEGQLIRQSVAIIEYIDDVYDGHALYTDEPKTAAKVREICEIINSGIQPLQNLATGLEMQSQLGVSEEDRLRWWKYWVVRGFIALDRVLAETRGKYAVGDEITAADAFIVPQVYNARRFKVEMEQFPNILAVDEICKEIEAFKLAHPNVQPDSPKE